MVDIRIQEIQSLLPRAMLPDWVRLGARLVRLLRDHHHARLHDAVLDRLLEQARASVALREQRQFLVPAVSYPPALPITARKDEIVDAIRASQVVVIAGETGSGKTTQIPKMCLEAGLGIQAKIGCTQPRRIAALSISRRIAEELNVTWGREVGCKIRFDDRSSPETYIKLMTDGILLAETQGDPLLSEYNAIIIDEAHERSLNIDFLLGYLKGLLARRTDLKLIITSATIDTESFSRAFNQAPVIEVSGRLYPVEVVYAPLDAASEESGELTYIDAAAAAAEQACRESVGGDVLVFMPGERDIRETCDLLRSRIEEQAEIIPLFGRLSGGDQQRVFAEAARRKIVVATNIAETSLTIPGIRYVVDAGLARISRYNARTRTKRLPVEPISQSSANQRKGRSGRVQNGVCIRLYSEADFDARPLYTQPEIQRANLAEVILRMKAFRLGEIETFPFLNPPSPAAIQGGYLLLQELGALDESRELTPLGQDLARLPIDPTLGRMLLQSQQEHATRELLIIASGLSIQDPRERPLDQKDAAAAAHKRFAHPESDFLTLLNIWNAVHEQWEALRTQNQRRKFCKANFLSYLRLREWQDLHAQLHSALEDLGTLHLNESCAAYDAIHRSILAGLLGHIGMRLERNTYQAAANRRVTVFPGSALFDRNEKNGKPSAGKRPAPAPKSAPQPEWMMAGEIVETSQLFARTIAGIDPLWVVQLAPHLCKVTHHNPHWSAAAGRVLAEEKLTLYGLEVHQRLVAYGNINPREATAIFIRSALVEEDLFPDPNDEDSDAEERGPRAGRRASPGAGRRGAARDEPPAEGQARRPMPNPPHPKRAERRVNPAKAAGGEAAREFPFLDHNRQVRHQIETWQTRVRRHDLTDPDEALCQFYAQRLENVSSLDELRRWLRGHPEPEALRASVADLAGGHELSYDAEAFPDSVALQGQPVPLAYAYTPGEEHDGVTFKLGTSLAQSLPAASVEWAVPGLREAQVNELLRALPKTIRRQLMPFPPKVAEIVRDLRPGGLSLKHDLARFIRQRYGIDVPPSAWPPDALPDHLRPRIEIVGPDEKTIHSGRDLNQLREHLEKIQVKPVATEDPAWARFEQQWERFGLTTWSFGDLPERLTVSETGPVPLYAWPGLRLEENQVNLRLFRAREAARQASLGGVQRLVELALQKDLAWLHRDMRALARFEPLVRGFLSLEDLQAGAFEHLRKHLLPAEPLPALTGAHFQAAVELARGRLPGLATRFSDQLDVILKLRCEILRRFSPPPAPSPAQSRTLTDLRHLGAVPPGPPAPPQPRLAERELAVLLPSNFLLAIPFQRLPHLPRYLKALLTRAERAALNPFKDQERARQLSPYLEALSKAEADPPKTEAGRRHLEEFRWMIQEFRVSLFAQELGTPTPISAKRLDQQWERIRQEG